MAHRFGNIRVCNVIEVYMSLLQFAHSRENKLKKMQIYIMMNIVKSR